MIKDQELSNPRSCLNRARPDELVFVLLARDPAMSYAIRAWIEARLALGKNRREDDQIKEAERIIQELRAGDTVLGSVLSSMGAAATAHDAVGADRVRARP